jgi:hypothetical protein
MRGEFLLEKLLEKPPFGRSKSWGEVGVAIKTDLRAIEVQWRLERAQHGVQWQVLVLIMVKER